MAGLWLVAYAVLKAQGLEGLDLDSAEQVYFAQSWQMGYGIRQPPLYTWLLLSLKPEAWPWSLMLELARYTLLLAWLGGVQALARACGASRQTQAVVLMAHLGLSLALWRVHDSLTHTVLAAALVTWGSAAAVRAMVQPRWWLLAGLLAGLACLAKFNAGLWWVSSLAAAWWIALRQGPSLGPLSSWRQTALWSLAGSGVAALVGSVYVVWWVQQRLNHQVGAAALVRQITLGQDQVPPWQPIVDLASGVLEYALIGPLLLSLIGLAALWARRGQSTSVLPASTVGQRWLAWQSALALLATALVLVLAQGSAFKSRWLWPVVPGLGTWLVIVAVQAVDQASGRWQGALRITALGCALLSIGLSAVRWWEPALSAKRCGGCWTDRPAADMARVVHQVGGPSVRVLTGDAHLAGILVAASPGVLSWAVTQPQWPAPSGFARHPGACLLAWVDMEQPLAPPADLPSWLAHDALAVGARQQVSWPLRHAPDRRVWFQVQRLDAQACTRADHR